MREWMRARRNAFFEGKFCVHCGGTENLELDHVDRSTKNDHKIWSWSQVRREAELAKCQVLCRTCHYAKTSQENIGPREHGTMNMHRKGKCRCTLCRAVSAAYTRDLRKRNREQLHQVAAQVEQVPA